MRAFPASSEYQTPRFLGPRGGSAGSSGERLAGWGSGCAGRACGAERSARLAVRSALSSLALPAHPAPRTTSRASTLPGSAPPLSRRRLARPAVGGAGGERRRPQPLSPPRKGAGLAGRPRALAGAIRAGGSAPGNWDSSGVRREYWLFPGTLLRQLALLPQVFPASYAPPPQGNCPPGRLHLARWGRGGEGVGVPRRRLPAGVAGLPLLPGVPTGCQKLGAQGSSGTTKWRGAGGS